MYTNYFEYGILIIGDNMNFVDKIRKRDEERLKELSEKYFIPKRFKSSAKVFLNNKSIIKDYDKKYNEMQYQIPKETGKILQELFDDDNYMLGIHRTNFSYEEIFKNGLKMRGNDFTDNVQISGYFPFLLEQIKYCKEYKASTGCIIVQIPKTNDKPIYFAGGENNSEYYLLPEYIAGYIPVFDKNVEDIIINPNYRIEHNYETDGLEYDERLEYPEKINMRKSK